MVTLGDALLAGGGLVIFIFSFLPFISAPSVRVLGTTLGGGSESAWGANTGALPVFVVIAGLVMIALGLTRAQLGGRSVLGFSMAQIGVFVALFAALGMLAELFTSRPAGVDFGVGAIFMLIGALAASVGAFMNHLNVGNVLYPSSTATPAA